MSVSATFYVTLNGGANQSFGVDAESEDTVALVPANTAGWLRARWEIYDYPEGFTAPAGWSTAASGTIYYEGINPPDWDLPDNGTLWGVWMLRVLVNEQIDTDEVELDGLLDDENAICLLSPEGLRDSGAREGSHFTTTTTRIKNWLRSYQRNLRALQNPKKVTATPDATPVVARRWLTPTNGAYSFRLLINVENADGSLVAEYELKGGHQRDAGTLSEMYAPILTVIHETAGLAAADATLTMDGNDAVELELTGIASALSWKVSEFSMH